MNTKATELIELYKKHVQGMDHDTKISYLDDVLDVLEKEHGDTWDEYVKDGDE